MYKKIVPLFLGGMAACAQLPPATVTYYLPKSTTTITVAQTITCDSAKAAHVSLSLNPKPVYSADYDVKNYENGLPKIHVKDLDNAMSDTDADFSFTDDGRLKGINVAQTGQASTVVKDLVSVGVDLGALAFTADKNKEWCEQADAAKSPVTITYTTGALAFKDLVFEKDTKIEMKVESGSQALFNSVTSSATFPENKMYPTLTAHAEQDVQTVSEDDGASGIPVVLPRMHKVTVELFWGESENKPVSVDAEAIYLPGEGKGRAFTLHIAKPEPFGSQKFILGLAESGAITDVHFVKTTGAGAALEAANSALTPLQPQTEAASRASAMKAQTDVEYEQQRAAACKASPSVSNCK